MHTPLMSVTTLTPFMMPYSCQIKIGRSNEITPFVSTVTPTAPFGNLLSSWPETANHSHPALAHHQDQLLPTMSPTMLHLSLARSTRQSYHTGIKRFIRFCRTQHVCPLPATSRTATYFATALHEQGMAPATICLYLSAVSACHRENGITDPSKDNPLLTLVKRGTTRANKCLHDQRPPLTYTILRHLIRNLKADQHLKKLDCVMLSAVFSLAFHGLLRVSEYTVPSDKAFKPQRLATLSDIQWHSQHFTLFLKQSKTDQQSRGTTINFCKLTKPTCTYHNMAAYIALASHKDLVITPLFCFSSGRSLTRLRLLKHLCRQLQRAPISIAHIASELAVQLQHQRLAPHRQPFSKWADGVARHTGATFVHPRRYQPWDPRKQWAVPQPQQHRN